MIHNSSYRLCEIRIIGGFLDGVVYSFSDKLNCIIGARGTGKTSILEFVRYALDVMPKNDYGARKRIENIVENNLAGGRIELKISARDGLNYIISRTAGEEPMVLTAEGQPSGINFSKSLFRIDVFSQNEVEAIADNTMSQLELIETFNQEKLSVINLEIARLRQELELNANNDRPVNDKIAELREETATLPGLTERLADMESDNDDETARLIDNANKQKALREREMQFAKGLGDVFKSCRDKVSRFPAFVAQQINWNCAANLEDSENEVFLSALSDILNRMGECVQESTKALQEHLNNFMEEFVAKKQDLQTRHQDAEVQYNRLIERYNADRSRIQERMKMEHERNELLAKEKKLQENISKHDSLASERIAKLAELSRLLTERFKLREEIVNRINQELSPDINVSLQQFGCIDIYQNMLAEGLRTPQMQYRQVATKLATQLSPSRLRELLKDGDLDRLATMANINRNQAKIVISMLKRDDFLASLEIVDLPDLPKIMLNDKGTYKTTDTLSTGQKCTAILPILLLESDRPLMIDQPEDNLDNQFVHSTIVKNIKGVKKKRQLVFVTHNPNIPVLGDAESIMVLESDGGHAFIRNSGSVDKCKTDIISLLEGGADAFRQRKERYGC